MVLAPHQVDATRAILRSLFDYAGLFPPAACAIAEAAESYERARRGPCEWMLGSFVTPLARVPELVEERRRLAERTGDAVAWPVSVLLGAADGDTVERLRQAREGWRGVLTLGSLEVGPLQPAEIAEVSSRLPSDVQVFFETPLDGDLDARLDAIAAAGGCAKVRMGGVVPDAFPPAAEVARFLAGCKQRSLPFKATAGLHHPLRGEQAVTYEPDSPRAVMHGFLNLAIGSLLLDADAIGAGDLEELLDERDGGAFELDPRAAAWRGHRVALDRIDRSRRSFFCSIGSCSFDEPVEELVALGVLDDPEAESGPRTAARR